METKKPLIIGIAGPSGSGKTSIAKKLAEYFIDEFGASAGVIAEDSYYKNFSHLSVDRRAKLNFDHPDAFDHDFLIQDLHDLLDGQEIVFSPYDYKNHCRTNKKTMIGPYRVIILEGIMVLNDRKLREIMDAKFYVDTDQDECFIRRLIRDTKERGRNMESVIEQYLKTVKPMFHKFVEPSRRYADMIIPQVGENYVAIDYMKAGIERLI